jgi:hypothetical protein
MLQMIRLFTFILLFAVVLGAGAVTRAGAEETLRGRVAVDLEPVYALAPDVPYPLDAQTVRRRALEEASLFFAAMIYGWDFDYEVGERARGAAEYLDMESRGDIAFGDNRLQVTDARLDGQVFSMWADYRLSGGQIRQVEQWRAGQCRNLQGLGHADLDGAAFSEPGSGSADTWLAEKRAALEDAARAGLRELLRGRERNRPRRAAGRIALAEFPRFYFDRGRWAVSARFRVEITEIEAFAAY